MKNKSFAGPPILAEVSWNSTSALATLWWDPGGMKNQSFAGPPILAEVSWDPIWENTIKIEKEKIDFCSEILREA